MLKRMGLAVMLAAPIAANAQGGPPAGVIAALTSAYGRYDPARRCWQASAQEGTGVTKACIAIRRADTVQASDGTRIYVMLNGAVALGCHACGGLIAFALFSADGTPRLLARSAALSDGGYGTPTDAKLVALQKLGADDWGWLEQAGSSGQGESDGQLVVWLRHGNQVVRAGTLTGSHDNNGTECGMVPHAATLDCYDIKVAYSIDASDRSAAHYPIMLQASGTKNARRISQQARSAFDAAAFAYVQPPGLP